MQPIKQRPSAPLVPPQLAKSSPMRSHQLPVLRGEVLMPERKSFGNLQTVGVQSVAGAPSTDAGALVNARRRNELVYACIDIKGQAVKDPRLIVQVRDKDGAWQEEAGHPFRRLMMRPNPSMDEAAFLRAAITSWDVAKKFYAEKVRSGAGAVVELHPLDPTKVKPVYRNNSDGSREVTAYEWKDGRYRKEIKPEDMLVRDEWELGNALSPLAVAMGSVDMDNAQTDYIRAFFNNAGVPSGIIKIRDRTIDPDESDHIRQEWKARYGRAWGNQHDVAVMDENADYLELGSKLSELDSSTLRSVAESRICMVFGVPPLIVYAYVGLLRSTYSNLKEAWAGFWDATLSPLLKDWRSFLTWSLLTEFVSEDLIYAERIRLAWDLSEVAALQEDVDAIQTRAEKAFRAGGITLNEYRAKLGEENDPAGDYYLRLLSYAPHAAGKGPKVEADDVLAGKGGAGPETKGREAKVSRESVERGTEREVATYLRREYLKASEVIRGSEE